MNNKTKTILGIVAFAVLIVAAYFAYNNLSEKYKPEIELQRNDQSSAETTPGTGAAAQDSQAEQSEKMKAPDFTVFDKEGNEVKLSSLFGKPIVLNFWASWCSPCKSEMPHFDKVYNDMKEEIVFMMVDLVDGQRETADKGKKYVEDQGFTFPVYFDTEQEAAQIYGISSIPTTIFIDKDGYIVTGAEGAIDEEILLKGIGYIK